MKKIDSIIFDLDGTMWDTRNDVAQIWNEVLTKYNMEANLTGEKIGKCMGMPYLEAIDYILAHVPEEIKSKIMEECSSIEVEKIDERNGGKIFKNVEKTIKELSKSYKLFIVSNCQKGYIESFLRINNLEEYFTDIEDAENTGLTKGENNKLIMERNNLKSPVYVGDTQGDADSAKFAEIPFIFANYGFGETNYFDRSINDISDLLKLDILY